MESCVFDKRRDLPVTNILKVPIMFNGREVEIIRKLGVEGYISFSCPASFDDFINTTTRIMTKLRESDGRIYEHIIDDKREIYTVRRLK